MGDTKPKFTKDTYVATIEEGRDPGTVIVKVSLPKMCLILMVDCDPLTMRKDFKLNKPYEMRNYTESKRFHFVNQH